MKRQSQDVQYYFDFIRINTKISLKTLKSFLPEEAIRPECEHLDVGHCSPAAKKGNFKSKIDIVAPSRKALELVSNAFNGIKNSFKMVKISRLEIARDTVCPDRYSGDLEASVKSLTLRKRWSTRTRQFDSIEASAEYYKRYREKGLFFGSSSRYIGGKKNYCLTVYPRFSKIDQRPCCHEEWRLFGAGQIRSKTNISTLSDLLSFDFDSFFRLQDDKYVRNSLIDNFQLGKWLLDWTRKKTFSDYEEFLAKYNGSGYCRSYKIQSPADLISHFTVIRDRTKSRGRRSKFENKVLKLRGYDKFFKPFTHEDALDRLYPLRSLLKERSLKKGNNN